MKKTPIRADYELTPDREIHASINWFPGHMAKAIKEIKAKLKLVDIVLEIRDARAPIVSGNWTLDETLREKSRLILFNKANLADAATIKLWDEYFKTQNDSYMFVNCFDKSVMKKVISMARTIVEIKRKKANPDKGTQKKQLKLMILGLPNTGKSTIINQIAGRAATKVADKPGQTQVQQWINIDSEIMLLDTPGVMPPLINNIEHGKWLSALNAIPDHVVGEEFTANFLVDYFRKNHSKDFMERYKLDTMELETEQILEKIAILRGCIRQKGLPDFERVYKLLLIDFRSGELGRFCFETPPKKINNN